MKKTLAIAAAAMVLAAPVAARAFELPFIPWVPDLCLFGTCVQFTQVTALAQLQSVLTELENLKTLHGFGMVTALEDQARVIYGQMHAVSPLVMGATAATTADAQQPDVSTHIAAANAAAQTATGALAATSASNLYLSTIASQQQVGNQMHSAEIQQKQAVEDSEVEQLKAATTGESDPELAP